MPRASDRRLNALIGQRLRELREESGMAQTDLAEQVGVEPETLSRAEQGHRAMSIANLARAASILRVPLSSLFEFDGPLLVAEPDLEQDLVTRFRLLSPEHREALIGIAAVLERAEPRRGR